MASLIHLVKQGGQLPFLDLLLNRTENGGLKLQIYMKPTHTDQYLNFSSHHPIEHKLSVVRTLFERSQCLGTEIEDRKQEDLHVGMWVSKVDLQQSEAPD